MKESIFSILFFFGTNVFGQDCRTNLLNGELFSRTFKINKEITLYNNQIQLSQVHDFLNKEVLIPSGCNKDSYPLKKGVCKNLIPNSNASRICFLEFEFGNFFISADYLLNTTIIYHQAD